MSKNLEKEYQNSIELSAPDLWGRISAGIDALEEKKAEEQVIVPMPRRNGLKRYSGLIAAAAVVVVAIPVVAMALRQGGSKTAQAENAMFATSGATSDALMTTTTAEACEEEEDWSDYMESNTVSEVAKDQYDSGIYGNEAIATTEAETMYDDCDMSESVVAEEGSGDFCHFLIWGTVHSVTDEYITFEITEGALPGSAAGETIQVRLQEANVNFVVGEETAISVICDGDNYILVEE